MLAAVAAASVAVLGGGIYLGALSTASGSPKKDASAPPARQSRATPRASPAPSVHPAGRAGDYGTAEIKKTFTEHSAAAGTRILRVTVRYPQIAAGDAGADAKYPLIVFAPGFLQCAATYSALLRQWASAGYVVAAVDFPRTSCNAASPDESDLSNQPTDMAFVISRLIALSDRSRGPLTGLISADQIAVAGHSDGGDTVAAMAAASCCRYSALRAVVVLAGAEWPPLKRMPPPGTWFSAPTPPMLFVQGTADTCNPPAASNELYQADTTGIRYYLELFGANHLAPYEGHSEPEPVVERVTLAFLDRYLAGQPVTPGDMRRTARIPGQSQLVSDGQLPSGDGVNASPTGC